MLPLDDDDDDDDDDSEKTILILSYPCRNDAMHIRTQSGLASREKGRFGVSCSELLHYCVKSS